MWHCFPMRSFLLFFHYSDQSKRLGIIEWSLFAITIAAGFIVPVGSTLWFSLLQAGIWRLPANSISALLSLLNFIIFFLGSNRNRFSPKQARRRTIYQKKVHVASQNNTHHRCAICGRTEKDDENLEFRFCSKCKGNYEYCQDHLFTHEHRK